MLAENPKAALSPGFITSNLKRNHVFHESAHCIAHALLRTVETDLRALAPDDNERLVLETVLAESFANSVERLGTVYRHLPLSDTLFYTVNSYVTPKPKNVEAMENGAAEVGSAMRFGLLLAASFEANLTPDRAGEAVYERISAALECDALAPNAAHRLVETAFDLNAGFRENTTPAYFELTGCLPQYRQFAGSEWLAKAENAAFFRNCVRLFAGSAGADRS